MIFNCSSIRFLLDDDDDDDGTLNKNSSVDIKNGKMIPLKSPQPDADELLLSLINVYFDNSSNATLRPVCIDGKDVM